MSRAIDIDEIVRAVLRELQAAEGTKRPESGATAGLPSSANTQKTLELTERLVTLATLENRLTGIDRLALRAGAVVTPSAIDELRSRGIEIVRTTGAANTSPAKPTLVLGMADVAEHACDAPALVAAITATGCTVERIARTGLNIVTAELAEQAALAGRPALLLTSRPAAAVCLANRRRGVRGVGGNDARYLQSAITDVAANFVAIDPAALSAFELTRFVNGYCTHWPQATRENFD